MIRNIVWGSAAIGLGLGAGQALAADLPVKAEPIEYVRICPTYGAGFYYIPGTDICLRVGGFVRADYYHNAAGAFPYIAGPGATGPTTGTLGGPGTSGIADRNRNTHPFRSRSGVILDARTNTAYGTLRSYLSVGANWDTSHPGSTSESVWADRAFIQFAGFTFGRTASFYDFFGFTGPMANLVSWNGMTTGATGWNVLAYTAQLGNGVSATLSLEDQRKKAVVFVDEVPAPGAINDRAGTNVPAIVGNIRVDQAWGSAQIMAAVQEVRDRHLDTPTSLDGVDDKWGYAFGGGFQINNPAAPGSRFGIQASYAKGATGYAVHTYTNHVIGKSLAGGPLSVGLLADGVYDVDGTMHLTKAWGVQAGYEHVFSPQWRASIGGGYTKVDYSQAVEDILDANLDYSFWSLGGRLQWTPVSNLNLALDLFYHKFDSQFDGEEIDDTVFRSQHVWSSMFRAQRNF